MVAYCRRAATGRNRGGGEAERYRKLPSGVGGGRGRSIDAGDRYENRGDRGTMRDEAGIERRPECCWREAAAAVVN